MREFSIPALVDIPATATLTDVVIERNERKGKAPSDHVPVVLTIAD